MATDPKTLRTPASCSPCRRAQNNPRRLKPRSNNPARCRVHARAAAAAARTPSVQVRPGRALLMSPHEGVRMETRGDMRYELIKPD